MKSVKTYFATIGYMLAIVSMNWLFSYYPDVHLLGRAFNVADILTGFAYIFRDFAQCEIGHKIFIAMFFGAVLSFVCAREEVALASVAAFGVGETLDWVIFTFAKFNLSKRLLLSSLISSPIDSILFLSMAGMFTGMNMTMMTIGKTAGIIIIWLLWKWRSVNANAAPSQ